MTTGEQASPCLQRGDGKLTLLFFLHRIEARPAIFRRPGLAARRSPVARGAARRGRRAFPGRKTRAREVMKDREAE
ncbi:MAG: hypothetical protein A2Y86_02340 [Candidatus Aminicenantes bacterium RBG_13_62_12]|nr:MAG: hypothetical protein A2Y86_02340 [Candidatus Aminicenantes bacterium RBG_13_62_12]